MLKYWMGCVVAFALCTAVQAEPAVVQSRVGTQIETFTLGDYRGKDWSLEDFKDSKLVVVAFVGTECPLVGQYATRLQELASKYGSNVAFLAIDANQQDSLAEIAHFARTKKIDFPILKDAGNKVADAFAAQRTPEVFVLDDQRKVAYHGRIDDQFTYGRQKPKVSQQYLVAAIDELLAGKRVTIAETEAVGCLIGRVLKPQTTSEVTYSQQISRIFQKRCVECHREGEIGPFALETYDDAVGWAPMIREVVEEQRMPPWHANPKHGKFRNDARLSDEEKQLIYRWVDAGAPEGDKKHLPEPRHFTKGWRIGEPDQVVYIRDKPFQVPATGEVRYQYFLVDPGFKEDTWIQAAECKPGNRAVVHHIIVGIQPPGGGRQREFEGVHSDWLTATAPGGQPLILPTGLAKLVPAGSKLVFQMHYTPNGTAQEDRSCVGFKFADAKSVRKVVGTDKAANQGFRIPPGAENHKVEATKTFGKDTLLLALFPHMHLRGKAFRYTAISTSGEREVLLDVPRYDFNWQNAYAFVEPVRMPAGSKLHVEAWFDNSENNLANPDPTATVRWGDQTWEEMMIGYYDATPADQDLQKKTSSTAPTSRTATFAEQATSGKPQLSDELKELALGALKSRQDFNRFSLALRKLVPQLDRCCWTAVEAGKLDVKLCLQEPSAEGSVGGAGRKVDVNWSAIAGYAGGSEPVVNDDLASARGIDLRFMAKVYASSVHVPAKKDKLPGTINFWSTEPNAFPPAAVELLAEVAKLMAEKTSPMR